MQLVKRLFSIFLLAATPCYADFLEGKVVKISDGDTVHILLDSNKKEKIRLSGIDAPERKQPFGNKSKRHLASLIAAKRVRVEFNKRDHYGRIVGKILFKKRDINLEMIKSGLAWHYKKYQHEQSSDDQIQYAVFENNARKQKHGVWVDKEQIAPWVWRKNKKNLKSLKIAVKETQKSVALNLTDKTINVWVNLKSGKYHCPNTKYYQNTKLGRLFQQKTALDNNYKPAHGIYCKPL